VAASFDNQILVSSLFYSTWHIDLVITDRCESMKWHYIVHGQ